MKVMKEDETRQKILRFARRIGAEEDIKQLFNKWDKAIALAPPSERKEMSKMAILEVQSMLDIHAESGEGLTVDGKIVVSNNKQ